MEALKEAVYTVNQLLELVRADPHLTENFAKVFKKFYDAFIAEGFTPDQAMVLCSTLSSKTSK